MACMVAGGWQNSDTSAFLCKIQHCAHDGNHKHMKSHCCSSNTAISCDEIYNFKIKLIFRASWSPTETQHFTLIDRQVLSFSCGPIKTFALKAKPVVMSFVVLTPDSYQYQIITLFHFQVGGQIAFLQGDAGQDGWKCDDVRRCSDSRLRETSGHSEALLASSPFPVTSSAPCQDFNIGRAVSHGHRAVRSCTGHMLE